MSLIINDVYYIFILEGNESTQDRGEKSGWVGAFGGGEGRIRGNKVRGGGKFLGISFDGLRKKESLCEIKKEVELLTIILEKEKRDYHCSKYSGDGKFKNALVVKGRGICASYYIGR